MFSSGDGAVQGSFKFSSLVCPNLSMMGNFARPLVKYLDNYWMTLCTDIHVPLWMNCNYFTDQSSGQTFNSPLLWFVTKPGELMTFPSDLSMLN